MRKAHTREGASGKMHIRGDGEVLGRFRDHAKTTNLPVLLFSEASLHTPSPGGMGFQCKTNLSDVCRRAVAIAIDAIWSCVPPPGAYLSPVGFFSHPDDNDFAHQKRKVASALASSRHTPDYIITFALSLQY